MKGALPKVKKKNMKCHPNRISTKNYDSIIFQNLFLYENNVNLFYEFYEVRSEMQGKRVLIKKF